MFMPKKILWGVLVTLSLILSACKSSQKSPTPTQIDPAAVFTAAAQTADARMTQIALITPTTMPTDTPLPPTATSAATPTVAPTTAAVTQAAGGGADKAAFVTDVTVSDYSSFFQGEKFTKTWRLKNVGTTTWTSAYTLVFVSGNQMGGAASIPLTNDVAPNATVDLSVELTAPTTVGQYTGYWMLRNPGGKNFGLGWNADQAIYVLINVNAGTVTPAAGATTATATTQATTNASATPTTPVAGVTASPTTQGPTGSVVSSVSMSIDTPVYSGACPHTFAFPVSFTLSNAAMITFKIEAGSDQAGYQFNLPAPTTAQLQAGTQAGTFNLPVNVSMNGWVQIHVTSPADVISNKVTFSLTCQ